MNIVIEMAREANLLFPGVDQVDGSIEQLERFAALVRADEREAAYKRRGVLMFNPYSGTPRHPSDITSDPHAILLLDPDQALRALKPTGGIEP